MKLKLTKSLSLLDLTVFGLNFMIPLAPAIVFGIIVYISGGSVALPYFIGFIAMLFTGYSFIKMSGKYPDAGSVFVYVSKSLGGSIGFIAGWMITLDYLLSPAITTASASIYLQEFFPNFPYSILVIAFISVTGCIAISGVKSVARLGLVILIAGELTVIVSLFVWGHHVSSEHGVRALVSSNPFYYTNFRTLLSASSVAAMCYFGFDAISAMSEEAKNPSRDIPLAIFLALFIGAATMILTGYFASLVQPDNSVYQQTDWQNAALFLISKIAGGLVYAHLYAIVFITSMVFLNVVAMSAVSRIIFSMSRDEKLPRIFAKLSPRFNTPYVGILFVMMIEMLTALFIHLELLSELISFGALSAFLLLNLGVLKIELTDKNISSRINSLIPLIGLCILMLILETINIKALYVCAGWLILGVGILYVKSKGKQKMLS